MAAIKMKSYTSPTLILLALDWEEGSKLNNFLGFAIRRTPGFRGAPTSWLTNRIGFDGPAPDNGFIDSNEAPIQKFMWWDAQIDTADRGGTFTYEAWPVRGKPGDLSLVEEGRTELKVSLPHFVTDGIGTWFNRAVVSSQAFSRILRDLKIAPNKKPTAKQELQLRTWLANGLETVVPDFLKTPEPVTGAIYHLEDELWIRPALAGRSGPTTVVFDARPVRDRKTKEVKPSPNIAVIDDLKTKNPTLVFKPRDKTNIMHNKILTAGDLKQADALLCGSANFTTGGLTTQANLLHTFASPALAQLYQDRVVYLENNPGKAETAKEAKWSETVSVRLAKIGVCFAPEPEPGKKTVGITGRIAMDPVVEAIRKAKSSVVFCLFTPTDKELRDECFKIGDKGLMMFGLVNRVSMPKPKPSDGNAAPADKIPADKLAQVEIYHRSRSTRDVVGAEHFAMNDIPAGFLGELKTFPGTPSGGPIPPVIIHHKFIVIDAEGDNPVIFSGSANMSNGSQYHNDENLLEIRGSKALAATYLAEFMRLYEHYRARADWLKREKAKRQRAGGYQLRATSAWAKKHYNPGSPEWRARRSMAD